MDYRKRERNMYIVIAVVVIVISYLILYLPQ